MCWEGQEMLSSWVQSLSQPHSWGRRRVTELRNNKAWHLKENKDKIENITHPKFFHFPKIYNNGTSFIWLKWHLPFSQDCSRQDDSGVHWWEWRGIVKPSRTGGFRCNSNLPLHWFFYEDRRPNLTLFSWMVYLTTWMKREAGWLNVWASHSALGTHPGLGFY